MAFHRDGSLKEVDTKTDFWENYRENNESGRAMLYRYEFDGVVVYDAYARLPNEDSENASAMCGREVTGQVKREIEGAYEYGKK